MIGKKMRIPLVLLAACSLAGCGTTKPDRVTGGAVTGAIAGGGIGALGGPVGFGTGLLIGALAGGGTGLISSPQDINLGNPPWHNTRVMRQMQ